MGFQLTGLQAASILVPVITAMVGGGIYLYDWYKQPDLTNGQWFESAWIEYGNNENTLNVVHIPDGYGQRVFLAVHEAAHRVDDKSWNPDIDSKPLRVNIYMFNNVSYVPAGSVLVCGKLLSKMIHEPHEMRIKDMYYKILPFTHIQPLNVKQYRTIYPNGTAGSVSAREYYDFWIDPEKVIAIYQNESLQRKIDKL